MRPGFPILRQPARPPLQVAGHRAWMWGRGPRGAPDVVAPRRRAVYWTEYRCIDAVRIRDGALAGWRAPFSSGRNRRQVLRRGLRIVPCDTSLTPS
jgi:hypothetical protein